MRKAYIQPSAEILKISLLINDFLVLSGGPGSDEEENEDNGMGDSDGEVVPSVPSLH